MTLQEAHKEEPHGLMGSGLLQREGGGGGPPGGRAGPAGAFDMRAGPRAGPHMGPAHGGPPGVGAGGPPAADTSRWDRGSMMPPPTGPPGALSTLRSRVANPLKAAPGILEAARLLRQVCCVCMTLPLLTQA